MECDFADLLHSIEVGQFQSTDELFEYVNALQNESHEDKTKITLNAIEKLKLKLNSDIKLINHLCEVLNMQLFNIEKGYALIWTDF